MIGIVGPVLIGLFAYQVQGAVVGAILGVAALVLMAAIGLFTLMNPTEEPDGLILLRRAHRMRWGVFCLFMIGIAVSGAEI